MFSYLCILLSCFAISGIAQPPPPRSFTPWSSWSRCTRSCGAGEQIRFRKCILPCVGTFPQIRPCNTFDCPVPCGLSLAENKTCADNGGTCVFDSCSCPEGFTGELCEKAECGSSDPCQNGKCNPTDGCVCAEGFRGVFCQIDECDDINCLNGASCERGSCICPAGFAGISCQDKLTSVKCGSSSMTVNIDQRLVQGDASGVHFRNHSCFGEDSSTPNEITLTTDYSQCGTSFEEDNTTITFSNVITYAKPGSEDDTKITRKYHMQVRVECCLEKEAIISGSFRPQLGRVAFSNKGSGDFSLRLQWFQTFAFDILKMDTASPVLQEDDLFFAVGLESVEDVGMFIDRCWATTKQGSDIGPQHSLISSGCPVDETVAINRSLGLHREGFSFEAFAFVGDYTEVYIHCSVKVCRADEAQSIRDDVCPPENGHEEFRKRRSSSFMSTQTISNGPIYIRHSTSNMASDDLSAYNPFVMLLLGMIATLVAMAIMIGVVKLVRNSTVINYQRLVPIGSLQEIE